MPDVCCQQYSPCNPNHAPGPPCASPAIYIVLVAAPVALLFWFRRNLHPPPLEQLPDEVPDQIPAIPDDLGAAAAAAAVTAAPDTAAAAAAAPDAAADAAAAGPITPPRAEAAYNSDGSGSSSGGDDEASRAEPGPSFINATVDRSGDVAAILDKMLKAFGGILLDIRGSAESTIHPANGLLMQSLGIFCGDTHRVQPIFGTGDYVIELCSVMYDRWVSKLEEDAERIGEKDRRYIFLLNNTYDVWQRMRCPGAPFSNLNLTSRLISMIQLYKKSYFDECWVSISNLRRLDKFASDFLMTSERQMKWKVTAELRYNLRQEILDLIVPSYEVCLLAAEANRRLPEKVYMLKRVMAGKKKQKKYTVETVKKIIGNLFEGT